MPRVPGGAGLGTQSGLIAQEWGSSREHEQVLSELTILRHKLAVGVESTSQTAPDDSLTPFPS